MDEPAEKHAAIDKQIAELEALREEAEKQRARLALRICQLEASIAELRRTSEWGV
jgi:phage shock protein A